MNMIPKPSGSFNTCGAPHNRSFRIVPTQLHIESTHNRLPAQAYVNMWRLDSGDWTGRKTDVAHGVPMAHHLSSGDFVNPSSTAFP